MRKNTCQFCGIEKKKIIENFLNHPYFGLVCPDCQKSLQFKKVLKIYNDKRV